MHRVRLMALCAVLAAPVAQAQQGGVVASDGNSSIGSLPCAALANAIISDCAFEILHHPDGKATMRVLLPDGKVRYIYFENGVAIETDSTERLLARSQNGTTFVFVGDAERYEIPDSVIAGS